jgi:hypothetical protein
MNHQPLRTAGLRQRRGPCSPGIVSGQLSARGTIALSQCPGPACRVGTTKSGEGRVFPFTHELEAVLLAP